MENSRAHSFKTELKNRTLWYDGDSTVREEQIVKLLSNGVSVKGLHVEQITPTIQQYNRSVDDEDKIRVKSEVRDWSTAFNLPKTYSTLNVRKYIMALLEHECTEVKKLSEQECKVRVTRTLHELKLFEKAGLTDFLRTLIFVINTLEERKVVWGVGRGSSVSSYVLYLIGVHDVDSVEYDLDITDFIHEE